MDKICRVYAHDHPNYMFIFGDNDARMGFGGLAAELRGLPNAFGIRVKKAPTMKPEAFYNDNDNHEGIIKINQDLQHIRANWNLYDKIVFPKAGVGTGRALLKVKAPQTYERLVKICRDHGFEQPS